MKTVFHLSSNDASAQSELLGNIQNLLDDKTVEVEDVAAVVNADAVDMLEQGSEASEFIESYPEKVKFYGCSNSLDNRGITDEELIERVEKVPSGVGKLNKLQHEDFNYIKI